MGERKVSAEVSCTLLLTSGSSLLCSGFWLAHALLYRRKVGYFKCLVIYLGNSSNKKASQPSKALLSTLANKIHPMYFLCYLRSKQRMLLQQGEYFLTFIQIGGFFIYVFFISLENQACQGFFEDPFCVNEHPKGKIQDRRTTLSCLVSFPRKTIHLNKMEVF